MHRPAEATPWGWQPGRATGDQDGGARQKLRPGVLQVHTVPKAGKILVDELRRLVA